MTRLSVFQPSIFVIASLALIAGCASPEAPPSGANDYLSREQTVDFDDPLGGFSLADEAPAFGDASMLDEFGEDAPFDDPFASDGDVTIIDQSDRDRLFLMVTWGNLHRDSTIAYGTNWSGSLSIDPGILLLKRTIRFEDNDVIAPRTSRDLIEWRSTTYRGVDGVLVQILPNIEPAISVADTMIDSSQIVVTFDTAPLKVELTLRELVNMRQVFPLDDGNAVAFTTMRVEPNACPHGFLRGVWRNHPERPGGVFFGKWEADDGAIRGFLRGHYGVSSQGEKVLFGKMITPNGRFEGIMRGHWDRYPDQESAGWFRGHWVDRHLDIKGGLKGEWRRSDRCDGGFFRGAWAMNCR